MTGFLLFATIGVLLCLAAADRDFRAALLGRYPHRNAVRSGTAIEPGNVVIQSDPAITRLPAKLAGCTRLVLDDCQFLTELPEPLRARSLSLRNAVALTRLPAGLDLQFLDVSGCTGLAALPEDLKLEWGALRMAGCVRVAGLPAGLVGPIEGLDISGCGLITVLPPRLVIRHWIDVAGSGLVAHLPALAARLAGLDLRWRGLSLPDKVAFAPDSVSAAEVLAETNVEIRRAIVERIGFERLLSGDGIAVIDRDTDAGGERKLLRLALPGDEPLVVVTVQCPSTGRRFWLRVPPTVTTCQAAVAWTAGFDDPNQYRPQVET